MRRRKKVSIEDVRELIGNIIEFIKERGEEGLPLLYDQLTALYEELEKGVEFRCYCCGEKLKLRDFLKTWRLARIHEKCAEKLRRGS